MPAEVQVISVGPWNFVGWPGEVFVEYDLMVKEQAENTFVIGLANGELQGYVVTPRSRRRRRLRSLQRPFRPGKWEAVGRTDTEDARKKNSRSQLMILDC